MIVASFYAPRFDKWGCDYIELLKVLDASCERWGVRHVVISDRQLPFDTFVCDLPENLMLAILDGQRQFLESTDDEVLLTGADCVIAQDPRGRLEGHDMAITIGPFADCEMNTGAIWCAGKRCAPVWREALKSQPREWGEDQVALYGAVRASGLRVLRHRCETHNWKPGSAQDSAGRPVVAHFRGRAKKYMRQWAWLHLALNVRPDEQ